MYRKILVGYDDRDQAKDALALGRQIADATGAELILAGVSQFDPVWQDWDPAFPRRGRGVRGCSSGRRPKQAGAEVEARPEQLARARPARPRREDRGRSDPRRLLPPRPCRPDPRGQHRYRAAPRRTLRGRHRAPRVPRACRRRHRSGGVGFDGSEESGHALMAAASLAADAKVPLKLISVAVPPPGPSARAGRRLARAARGDRGADPRAALGSSAGRAGRGGRRGHADQRRPGRGARQRGGPAGHCHGGRLARLRAAPPGAARLCVDPARAVGPVPGDRHPARSARAVAR